MTRVTVLLLHIFRIAGLGQRDTRRDLPHVEKRAHTHKAGVYLVSTYVRMDQYRKNPAYPHPNRQRQLINQYLWL